MAEIKGISRRTFLKNTAGSLAAALLPNPNAVLVGTGRYKPEMPQQVTPEVKKPLQPDDIAAVLLESPLDGNTVKSRREMTQALTHKEHIGKWLESGSLREIALINTASPGASLRLIEQQRAESELPPQDFPPIEDPNNLQVRTRSSQTEAKVYFVDVGEQIPESWRTLLEGISSMAVTVEGNHETWNRFPVSSAQLLMHISSLPETENSVLGIPFLEDTTVRFASVSAEVSLEQVPSWSELKSLLTSPHVQPMPQDSGEHQNSAITLQNGKFPGHPEFSKMFSLIELKLSTEQMRNFWYIVLSYADGSESAELQISGTNDAITEMTVLEEYVQQKNYADMSQPMQLKNEPPRFSQIAYQSLRSLITSLNYNQTYVPPKPRI